MTASRRVWIAVVVAALLAVPAWRVGRSLAMTRGGMKTFISLLSAANAQDLDRVGSLCSRRYLLAHRVERAREGGVVGLPRNIHKNFQVWAEGADVWLCPTDRVGPVYRLVNEEGSWKVDGLVGLLGAGGRVEASAEADPSAEIR